MRRSSVACARARSPIRVLPRSSSGGCKGRVLRRPLRAWISTPCRRRSWSLHAGLVRLASLDESVLAALVEQVLAGDELASSS
jgi:hypothetical protein